MNQGKYVVAQLADFLPRRVFDRIVKNHHGYKNHAKVDSKSKFINKFAVTDASVHDSQPLDDLLDKSDKGQPLYEDSAYTGEKKSYKKVSA